MPVAVIIPPSPIVSLDEAKKHLRVEHDDDNVFIESLVAAATAWLDGPAGWLGRCLGTQILECPALFACGAFELPYPPPAAIVSITAEDSDGTDVVADPDTYELRDGFVVASPGAPWVSMVNKRVRFRAGYGRLSEGENPQWINHAVPDPVRVAIMMLVAQWYRTREPVAIGASVETLPFAVDALLAPYRVYR